MECQFITEYYQVADEGVKQASVKSAREEVEGIMKTIYDENPSYWPYGLKVTGHTDLYLVRDNMTKKAAGFVGWQQQVKGNKRVGSYTIGILPEFRGQGKAKEALGAILNKCASRCDEVRAYIVPENKTSHKLAEHFNIPIQEEF